MMRYYMIWYNDSPESGVDVDDYVIVHADSIEEAQRMGVEMFGDYVISVEPYNP